MKASSVARTFAVGWIEMQHAWPIFAIFCFLANFLVPGTAVANMVTSLDIGVEAFDSYELAHAKGAAALTHELRPGYELADYDFSFDSLLAAKGGARSIDDLLRAGQRADRNGLTAAGRGLQKHGDRVGSVFPSQPGMPQLGMLKVKMFWEVY